MQDKKKKKSTKKKASSHKFKYKLPSSFCAAVNKARLEDGHDILPRFHNLSVSSSSSKSTHKHQEEKIKKTSQTPGRSRRSNA